MGINRRNILLTLPAIAGSTIVLAGCNALGGKNAPIMQKDDVPDTDNQSDNGGGVPIPTDAPEVNSQDIDGVSYTMMPEFLSIGGGPTTGNKVRIYSDMSCPHCKTLDEEISGDLQRLILDEQLVAEFVIVNYLGEQSSSSWSLQAANLLGSVAEFRPDKFLKVKEELYKNQPEEGGGEYTSEHLRDLVADVVEFSDDEIEKIDVVYYIDWVNITVNNFAATNLVSSVPTVVWNETVLENYGEIVDILAGL